MNNKFFSKAVANFIDTPFDEDQESVKDKATNEKNFVNFSNLDDFTGTIIHFTLRSLDLLSHDKWIIDIGTFNDICATFNLIIDPKLT